MIGFLAPFGLFFALLALPILAMYMLKLRRREIEVPSTMLWAALLRDRQANTPWQRLKRNLLLILQLLVLAALVTALARPALAVRTVASGSLVVVLDGSASMAATDVPPTRFEAARAKIKDLIASLEPGARMTLIEAANPALVLVESEPDPGRLLAALANAALTQGAADWQQTFALAAGAAARSDGQKNTVIILSDGGLPTSGLPALPGEVRYLPVGATDDNLAISQMAVRPDPATGALQLFVRVHNYASSDRHALLSVEADGQLITARQVTVPAGSQVDLLLAGLPEQALTFKAHLSPSEDSTRPLDALPLDDTAFALHRIPPLRSALIFSKDAIPAGDENVFLFSMLRVLQFQTAAPSASLPITGTTLAATLVPTSTLFNLYVFDGLLPASLPKTGSLLVINPPGDIPGLLEAQEPVTVTGHLALQNEFRSAGLLAKINWEPVYISRARPVQAAWARPVVAAGSLSLVLQGELNGRRIVVLTFNLHDSNLPLEVAYPILMTSLLDYLAPQSALQNAPDSLQPGAPLEIFPQPGVTEVVIGQPDQSFVRYSSWTGSISGVDTRQAGLYAVNLLDGSSKARVEYFAVNLFDPGESNIAPARSLKIGQAGVQASAAEEVGLREYWPWMAFLALAVLMVEWMVYHRRLSPLQPGKSALWLKITQSLPRFTSKKS